MNRNINREEALRIAAEKVRLKKEKEAREEREFYERITSGKQWLLFKIVVVFCTAMALATTIEIFVDGPTKKLSTNDWKIDQNWDWPFHKVLDVKGYMFTPELNDWSDRKESTMKLTYSPIFRTGKTLSYDLTMGESITRHHEEIRQRSIFTWFPLYQIVLLLPLTTYILRRQSAWFNFARIGSFVFVFPGSLLVMFLSLLC